jgi:hypothetical protein
MKILRRYFLLVAFWLLAISFVPAQEVRTGDMAGEKVYLLKTSVVDGDTIPHIVLREVKVVPDWKFRNKRERKTYNRMVRNIKIALPYARLASQKLERISYELAYIEGEKKRKEFLKESEKELLGQFEKPLRKLNFSQGRMLIKLIDRETGNTSYDLIKDYKGGFSAFFWQSVARVFGSNLKDEYDGDREDKMIEHIIIMIDNGIL